MSGKTSATTQTPFRPNRIAPCPCGSSLRFKSCCGTTAADRPPPKEVMLYEGVLDPGQCRTLVDHLQKQPRTPLLAGSYDADSGQNVGQQLETRVTEKISLGDMQPDINNLVGGLWHVPVAESLGVKIEWFEAPHILYYPVGGQFTSHADSEVFDPEIEMYRRVVDRDLSMLLYLNEDFEGGTVSFDFFHYNYRPKAGDLLIFPSDHRYTHHAQRVTAGQRYAVVSWAKIIGSPQVVADIPAGAVLIKN